MKHIKKIDELFKSTLLSDLNIDDVEYVKSISINQLFTTK